MGSCNSVDVSSEERAPTKIMSTRELAELVNAGTNEREHQSCIKPKNYNDIVKYIEDQTKEFNDRACKRPIILKQDGSVKRLEKTESINRNPFRFGTSSSYYSDTYSDYSTSTHSSDYIYVKPREEQK